MTNYQQKNRDQIKDLNTHSIVAMATSPEYKAAKALASKVIATVDTADDFPGIMAIYAPLRDQLVRSITSILLNLAEAHGKISAYPLRIARGEAFESYANISLWPDEIKHQLQKPLIEVIVMLNNLIIERAKEDLKAVPEWLN